MRTYGAFSEDGSEYAIADPGTPRPWANVIANPRMGLAVSQSGSGFTWIDNSQLAVLTAWQQDLCQDTSGKFLYLRDADSGALWSLSPAPTWAPLEFYRCRHGLGYTVFETLAHGVAATWTLFVHAEETVELWLVELEERSGRPRTLELTAALEWCMGVAPAPRREFHKLFLETVLDEGHGVILARSRMWDVANRRFGHWNTDFPYVAAFACSEKPRHATGDKAAFLGRYGTWRAPAALAAAEWPARFGRHQDPVAAMRFPLSLAARGTRSLAFALAAGPEAEGALALALSQGPLESATAALADVRESWTTRLKEHRMETPEAGLDPLINDWVRYQAISARLWGRCGYYQQSGAFGFRDQLQDAQVWLTIAPERCREQIRLHAAHQFRDGSVYHWWHPLTEQGHITRMTDDLLWLAFVMGSYLRETGRFDLLDDRVPFLDEPEAPLREHVERAFARVHARTSPRGIPFIGAGDWNDGLSACGLEERGESVWLAMFLAGLLAEWAEIARRSGDGETARTRVQRREALVAAVNAHAWDGAWYVRGTLDDGSVFGSSGNRTGRIFLNAQIWAVLSEVAPPERAAACMAAVKEHLVSEAGALLLAPAYDEPDERIGYITRYAPGLRENGGVYTHAAIWALAAACKVKDGALAGALLRALNPGNKDPDRYWAEPYVLPGNVDGPDSPLHGRAGWTWYTGSAAWLHRVVAEWVLGVRPTWEGLLLEPCLPPEWPRASMVRPWRGATYRIDVVREGPSDVAAGTVLPPPRAPGEVHHVRVSTREA